LEVVLNQKSQFRNSYTDFSDAFVFLCFFGVLIIPEKVTFRAGLYMNFL